MNRVLFIGIFILTSVFAFGNDFEKGVKEYNAGNYEIALVLFKKEIQKGNHSSGVYSNIGRTYFELDSLGKSVWAYQMGLKVDPSDDQIIADLEFLETQISDDVELYERSLMRWFEGMAFGRSQNFWAYAGIIFSVFLSILILLKFRSQNNLLKTFSFYGAWVFGFLLVLSIFLSYFHTNRLQVENNAVVINKTVEIYSNPTSSASSIASLNEGTVFEIMNSTEGFLEIKLGQVQGWVHSEEVWKY